MPIVIGSDSPFLQAALQFVGGYGQGARETRIANQQQRARQQEILANSIGNAIGQIGSAPFQAQIMEAQRRNALADRLAIVQAQHANDLSERFVSHWGETPDAMASAAFRDSANWTPPPTRPQIAPLPTFAPGEPNFTPAEQPNMTPAEQPNMTPAFGPPVEPGTGGYVPPPPGTAPSGYGGSVMSPAAATAIADQNSGMQRVWSRDAQAEMARLDESMQAVQNSRNHSPEEKARAIAYLSDQRVQLRKVQTPAPVTMQQRAQIESWTDPRTGFTYHSKDLAVTPPTKKSEETDMAWTKIPDPVPREAALQNHIKSRFGGDYAAFVARGGYVTIDGKGDLVVHEPKPDEGRVEYGRARAKLFEPDPFGHIPASDPKVLAEFEQSWQRSDPEVQKRLITEATTLLGGNGSLQGAVDYAARVVATYGSLETTPEPLQGLVKRVRAAYSPAPPTATVPISPAPNLGPEVAPSLPIGSELGPPTPQEQEIADLERSKQEREIAAATARAAAKSAALVKKRERERKARLDALRAAEQERLDALRAAEQERLHPPALEHARP